MDKDNISTEALKENNEALVKKYIDMEDASSSDDDTMQQEITPLLGTGSEADEEEEEIGDEVEEGRHGHRHQGGRKGSAKPPDGVSSQARSWRSE